MMRLAWSQGDKVISGLVTDTQLLSCKVPNISATRLQDIPDKTLQETPSVGVEDRSDYLRSGNVKPDDQSLGLPDQKTS
jgi:hypothetical protein